VKLGYGSLREVETMDARQVLQALHYEEFCGDYESAYAEMNK
jgi:hypothetical protein